MIRDKATRIALERSGCLTGKRFSRWYPDERRRAVAAEIDVEVVRAAEAEKLGGWITYLIRDPSRPDFRGSPAGYPIYIGQSKELATRVLSRFLQSEKKATKKDSIEKRVADLLHNDIVVRYEVLERTSTHLSSLVSETNWVMRCRRRGYNLANQWAEQKITGPFVGRYDVPQERLWCFTLSEALEDEIVVELRCTACDFSHQVDLQHLQALEVPPQTLSEIKNNTEIKGGPCHLCGGRRFVGLRVL